MTPDHWGGYCSGCGMNIARTGCQCPEPEAAGGDLSIRADGRIYGATPQQRVLLSSVPDPESGCWIWQRKIEKSGYGRLTTAGPRQQLAHRFAYEAFVGPIPEGMTIDHLCFTPPCVNPEHLTIATAVENSRRQRSALASTCSRGHEFTPENTYRYPTSGRQCRACALERSSRRWREIQERRSAS